MSRLLVLLLLIFLTSCGGVPTADIEPLLFQPGDLTAQYEAGQVSDGSDGGPLKNAEDFTFRVQREIEPAPAQLPLRRNYVAVALFENNDVLTRNFEKVLPELTERGQPASRVGEIAISSNTTLLFTRCNALVAVQVFINDEPTADRKRLVRYGRRLDERLTPIVC